jgi:hypothetical protein
MRLRAPVSLLGVLLVIPTLAAAQLKVALDVTEETGGTFESVFRSALGKLDGVQVVQASERGDFTMNVIVLCLPKDECQGADSYAVSVYFTAPISRWYSDGLADDIAAAVKAGAEATEKSKDDTWQSLRNYEIVHQAWVASWGRNRYEQLIREFVGSLDTRCFEKQRMLARWTKLMQDKERGAADILWDDIFSASRKWVC